jgi:hypothetical protein
VAVPSDRPDQAQREPPATRNLRTILLCAGIEGRSFAECHTRYPYHAPDSGFRVSDFLTHHAVMLDFAMQPLIAVKKAEKAQSLRRYFVAPRRMQRIS